MRFCMKLAAAGALLAAGAMTAMAAQEVHASVPFAFKAGAKTLPAGDYSMKVDEPARSLAIYTEGGKFQCRIPFRTRSGFDATRPTTLYFDKDGDAYSLSAVQPSHASEALVLSEKKKRGGGAGVRVVGSSVN
jgi:hypothetical protein